MQKSEVKLDLAKSNWLAAKIKNDEWIGKVHISILDLFYAK